MMEEVKKERERLQSLVRSAMRTRRLTGVPENFTFHPDLPHLYFIGLEPSQSSSLLYYVDLSKKASDGEAR